MTHSMITTACVFALACCRAADAAPPATLRELAESPLCGRALVVTWAGETGAEGKMAAIEIVVAAEPDYSTFASFTYSGTPEAGRSFVQVGRGSIRDGGQHKRYREVKVPDSVVGEGGFPGVGHLQFNPWPVLPAWLGKLSAASDAQRGGVSGVDEISSASLGMRLEYHVKDQRLVVERGVAGAGLTRTVLEGLPTIDGLGKTSMRQEFSSPGKPTTVWTGKLRAVESDEAKAKEAVRFVPASWNLGLFDHSTGDVYGADGKLLYNENKLLAQMDGSRGWIRENAAFVWGAVAAVGVASCVYAYRRRQMKGRAA